MLTRTKPIKPRAPKPVRCKAPGCTERFMRRSMAHKACSGPCAEVLVNLAKAKEAERQARQVRAQTRQAKEAAKPRRVLMREAQEAFNWYIRLRDAKQGCISCGDYDAAAWDAGHYLSIGAHAELRFDEDNVHKQCTVCNQHKAGNQAMYRIGLVARCGLEAVERLEGPHPLLHLADDELRALRDTYRSRARQLERGLQN